MTDRYREVDQGSPRGTGSADRARAVGPVAEWVTFVLLAGVVLYLATRRSGIDFSQGDLIDTDGYMRFVRVQHLLDGGGWFSSVSPDSNGPFGEVLHWTRPLDLVVLGLAGVLNPFLAGDALYAAAVVNAPLLFAATALIARIGLGPYLPASTRHVLLPGLLAAPVVISYALPGRLDHHVLLLLLLVVTLGALLKVVAGSAGALHVTVLGGSLATGTWVSTEYLVPAALTWLTLMGLWALSGDARMARTPARVFAAASVLAVLALLVERGHRWWVIEHDKISLLHVSLIVGGWAAAVATGWSVRTKTGRSLVGLIGAAIAGAVILVVFPDLMGGPFVAVDPVVGERWLESVGELRPLFDGRSLASLTVVGAPLLLGGVASVLLFSRNLITRPRAVLVASFVVYSGLAVYQVRWALFAQLLAVPLIVVGLSPLYVRFGRVRHGPALRALATALILGGFFLVAALVDVSAGQSRDASGPVCVPAAAMAALNLQDPTVVLADQDLGPEILYRTSHEVIATPYHRNTAGLRFLFATMAAPPDEAHRLLGRREVGLVLLCPGPQDLTYPLDPGGSFYQALVDGPLPDYVEPVPLAADTDYLLFVVDP